MALAAILLKHLDRLQSFELLVEGFIGKRPLIGWLEVVDDEDRAVLRVPL